MDFNTKPQIKRSAALCFESTVHDGKHAIDGTASSSLLDEHLMSNDDVYSKAIGEYLARGYSEKYLGNDRAAAADTTYDHRYRSIDLDADTITQTLERTGTTAFSGEMDAEQQANFNKFTRMFNAASDKSGGIMRFVVTNEMPSDNALWVNDKGIMMISADTFKSNSAAKNILTDTFTEVGIDTHESLDTDFELQNDIDLTNKIKYNKKRTYRQISKKEYAVISSRIMQDNSRYMARNQELPRYGSARSADYFYVYENFAPGNFGVLKQIKIADINREYIASIEAKIGENNGEQTIGSTSELNRVLKILKTRTRRNHSNNALNSQGRSNSNDGGFSFEKSASKSIRDIKESVGDIGISKYGDLISSIIADTFIESTVHEGKHAIDGTASSSLLDEHLMSNDDVYTKAIGEYLSRGYSEKYLGNDRAEAAKKLADIVERGRTGKELSADERAVFEEFESEWPAFASQQVLGTEEFVRHLVKNDLGTVEKILGTIQDIKKMLSNRNNPDAKKAADFVKKAEQLYIDALEEIGAKYVNNKIIGANDEEEETSSEIKESKKRPNEAEKTDQNKTIINLSDDSELSHRVDEIHGAERYKIIQAYILEVLKDQPVKLSDGKLAIVDNRDAIHIANKSGNKKTAHISKIKEIIEKATFCAEDTNVEHNKFNYFCYYKTKVQYENSIYPLYLNVGRGINDGKYHIYDITEKIRDTAGRINGLERPKPNEGYALKNDISINSISQTEEKSTVSEKKVSDNIHHSHKASADTDRVTITKGALAKLKANYEGEKVFNKKDIAVALNNIEALKVLSKSERDSLVSKLFEGYNIRLDAEHYEQFSEIMYNKIRARILQESDFELNVEETSIMDEQIVKALNDIVASGKESTRAKLEYSVSGEGLIAKR